MRKLHAAVAAAFVLSASVLATVDAAEARPWRRHYYGGGWRGPAAVGVVGALALGAMAAGAYGAPRPVYGGCYVARRPIYDQWGYQVGSRRVRVCE
jgi:hypothetical protein